MQKRYLLLTVAIMLFCMFLTVSLVFAESVPRMSTNELKTRLEDADLVVLDVRAVWDWSPAEIKIAGAERVEPSALGQWLNDYPKGKTIVLYCA